MSQARAPGQDKSGGALAENILHFARALRAAGLPIGTGAALDAISAIEVAGVRNRDDFRVTLEAVFVKKREHAAVFDEAFRIFWRRRGFLEQLMTLMSPVDQPANGPGAPVEKPAAAAARVAQALMGKREPEREESAVTYDQSFTVSQEELLQRKDFAQMSAAEIADALRAIAALDLSGDERRTRRFAPARSGARIDLRRTLRRSMRGGGSFIDLARTAPQVRKPPIVILCDISGSMAEYTRVFLHFFHALTEKRGRVHTFLFGTRLTNVTRALRHKDPDEALAQCSGDVLDWSGGTRIGQCLRQFNRDWSRRVLGQGATVLIFTDGLEREGVSELAREMERLHKSARRLVWLNPLLRFERFEPRAQGVWAMLPHVDEFRAVHNLASVAALAAALSAPRTGGAVDPRMWLKRVG